MGEYVIELFDKKQHDISRFSCGEPELDNYLKQHASQDTKRKVTIVYVIRTAKFKEIIGYYTLNSSSIELNNLPASAIKKLPRYKSLPTILIGRLAVDSRHQKKGIGEKLLMNALVRSYKLSEEIGCYAVIVDAKDKKSSNFYEKYGFIKIRNNHFRLYIPMLTIKLLFAER